MRTNLILSKCGPEAFSRKSLGRDIIRFAISLGRLEGRPIGSLALGNPGKDWIRKKTEIERIGKIFSEIALKESRVGNEILSVQLLEADHKLTNILISRLSVKLGRKIEEPLSVLEEVVEDIESNLACLLIAHDPDKSKAIRLALNELVSLTGCLQRIIREHSVVLTAKQIERMGKLEGNIGRFTVVLSTLEKRDEPSHGQNHLTLFIEKLRKLASGGKGVLSKDAVLAWNEYFLNALRAFQPANCREIENFIDGQVYRLATGPKGGASWGKHHRFDDLKRFEKAIVQGFAKYFERYLKKESICKDSPDRQAAFYRYIYEKAGSPEGVDPLSWAKDNMLFYHYLSEEAFKKIQTT